MKDDRSGPYLDLVPEEVAPGTLSEDSGLFLGRFTPALLERELEESGILSALGERGYERLVIETDVQGSEHRLRILSAPDEPCLVELRLSEATCLVEDPLVRLHGVEVLYLLTVHWVTLQHPRAAFTMERPCLPGQVYPGLGFGRRLYGCLMNWAHEWGKDALLNFPEYFHNAVFYATLFRFLSPRRQGRFEAMRRDLGHLHVSAASSAIAAGRVIEEPAGEVARWEAGEMVAPITRSLREFLDSPEYHRAVQDARENVSFRMEPQVA